MQFGRQMQTLETNVSPIIFQGFRKPSFTEGLVAVVLVRMVLRQVWTARNTRIFNDFQWVPQRIRCAEPEALRALQFGRQLQKLELLVFPMIFKGFE